MEKELLENLIRLNFSQREIGEKLGYCQSSVRYWLKMFGLKTNVSKHNEKIKLRIEKLCPKCNLVKSVDEFYGRSDRDNESGYCKTCSNKATVERVRNVKIKMINYKGGCCKDCGLKLNDSHYSVFDFHHTNPKNKDINFGRIKFQKWEVIKKEIDKCELLCANCHRIKHST